jgi:hypothetical protein
LTILKGLCDAFDWLLGKVFDFEILKFWYVGIKDG